MAKVQAAVDNDTVKKLIFVVTNKQTGRTVTQGLVDGVRQSSREILGGGGLQVTTVQLPEGTLPDPSSQIPDGCQ